MEISLIKIKYIIKICDNERARKTHSHFPETLVLISILLKWRPIYRACNFCKRLCCVYIRLCEASISIVFRDHIFEYMTLYAGMCHCKLCRRLQMQQKIKMCVHDNNLKSLCVSLCGFYYLMHKTMNTARGMKNDYFKPVLF